MTGFTEPARALKFSLETLDALRRMGVSIYRLGIALYSLAPLVVFI